EFPSRNRAAVRPFPSGRRRRRGAGRRSAWPIRRRPCAAAGRCLSRIRRRFAKLDLLSSFTRWAENSIMSENLRPKRTSESAIHDQTAIGFPNDLNSVGTLCGGRVLEQADIVAAVVTKRHCGRVCVTLGVDSVRFLAPARHGEILVFQAAINRVWRTSMEVGVKVWSEDFKTPARRRTHIFSAYFT